MEKEFDASLRELLGNHTEQPSLGCWDKISSHLDAVQAVNATSAATANVSQFSQFVGSVVGKIAVTATIAASVATAAYFIIGDKEETIHPQEIAVTELINEEISLPAQYLEAEIQMEEKAKKTASSDKLVQTSSLLPVDEIVEQKIEEHTNVLPAQPKETAQQSIQPTPKDPATESPKETKTVAEPQRPKEKEKEKELIAEIKEEEDSPKQPQIGIPNVITPNGDGVNDFFVFINIEQVTDTQLDIYTKEGRVVYSKRSYDNSWDGRGLPDETYFYIFRFVYEGNQFMRKGSVTIRR
jgi:gliding motility-associated-like protein